MAGRSDTVVKARYSRGGQAALKLTKEHLRYAVHRANEQGQRQYREVWDRAGQIDKSAAYERLDRVGPNDHIYRFTLSPHPERQDAGKRLDLRSWTREMFGQLEQRTGQRLEWFAVTHEHRDHRHVHAVVVSARHLDAHQFQAMRETGDANARSQQREPRPGREHPRSRRQPERDVATVTRTLRDRQVGA
ncbi:MAG: hypothetical protein JOY61_10165 [Chloroflexi bacterium]|nr:hypothetical protein [Chloroflexota bacterium]